MMRLAARTRAAAPAIAVSFGAALLLAAPAPALADAASDLAAGAVTAGSGKSVYEHVCQGCHQADARGARGAGAGFPALANNPHLENAGYPISMIENGGSGMPWFNGMLSDAQVAAVVNYVRTHFGNHYTDSVTPAEVALAHGAAPHLER